ncbi:MAG: hypothetical protein IPL47_03625 [Phyllobacteriaceae bacterium]|nr:hypothetical protein [Phyllobacteriaceae bacterium]
MMIRVRNAVEEATEQTQTPWDQSSLRSQFYFNPVEEENEALTEEDLALLSELDPALLEKFKKKFGLKIVAKESEEGGESLEAEGGGEIIASIEPTLIIQDVEPAEPAGSAAERTAAASPAEPVQPQEAVDAGLIILSADEGGLRGAGRGCSHSGARCAPGGKTGRNGGARAEIRIRDGRK